LSVDEIVAWQNGRHPLNLTRFDSDFAALYWPWVKVRDTHNRIDVWVPPSGAVAATYANADNLAFPWFAPAGMTRGIVYNITDTYTKPTLEERDLMYGNRNCVNPIIIFPDQVNFMIWGQKTLQRLPTALDRVNVRRMLLYIEKLIRRDSRRLLFEPHDAGLRAQFIQIATGVLDAVVRDRGITDYFVKCDEELNTPDVIDRNELRANIGVQPTRAAEFIMIEFSLHRTGSFTENTNTF
jgi:phage tail sheath protein FI